MFDLDRTLTHHGTYSPFLIHSALRTAPWRLVLVPIVLGAMVLYKLGRIRPCQLKEVMHRLMLGPFVPRERIDRLAAAFSTKLVKSGIPANAIRLIERERQEGRILILATAAHRFYAQAIADQLGLDHLVATSSRWCGEMLTPRIMGENCHGPAKAAALMHYLDQLGLDRAHIALRCYSDDISDMPCFDASNECVAVNPSRSLARIAAVRGWRILDLREKRPRH